MVEVVAGGFAAAIEPRQRPIIVCEDAALDVGGKTAKSECDARHDWIDREWRFADGQSLVALRQVQTSGALTIEYRRIVVSVVVSCCVVELVNSLQTGARRNAGFFG